MLVLVVVQALNTIPLVAYEAAGLTKISKSTTFQHLDLDRFKLLRSKSTGNMLGRHELLEIVGGVMNIEIHVDAELVDRIPLDPEEKELVPLAEIQLIPQMTLIADTCYEGTLNQVMTVMFTKVKSSPKTRHFSQHLRSLS